MSYRTSRSLPPRRLQTHCRIDIRKLDIAKGHDGLLRGRPEPVVVFGVFVREPSSVRLVDGRACRFHSPARFPASAPPHGALRFDMLLDYAVPAAVACVAFALEHDSGEDVAEMAAALDRWQRLRFAPLSSQPGAPLALPDCIELLIAHDAPRPVDAWIDGEPVTTRMVRDDWVGASVFAFAAHQRRRCARRMHFTSRDRTNDWTLVLDVRLGSPRVWPEP